MGSIPTDVLEAMELLCIGAGNWFCFPVAELEKYGTFLELPSKELKVFIKSCLSTSTYTVLSRINVDFGFVFFFIFLNFIIEYRMGFVSCLLILERKFILWKMQRFIVFLYSCRNEDFPVSYKYLLVQRILYRFF
jgi:hypothetical protein